MQSCDTSDPAIRNIATASSRRFILDFSLPALMMKPQKCLLILALIILFSPSDNLVGSIEQPEFIGHLENVTVPFGKDATLTCTIKNLGPYRVGWVKFDTKAIQAIHDHVITDNRRVSVNQNQYYMWNLMIKNVDMDDDGIYMCQLNTNPMKSQKARLTVVVPPSFEGDEAESTDVNVAEHGMVSMACRAKGVPQPKVVWRREDGENIVIRETTETALYQKARVAKEYYGDELSLTKVSRTDMATYVCIASNGVPPSVSKRIHIYVHFAPTIHVPNQLVGAPLGTDVALECFIEASPMSISYWIKDKGSMIISSSQHIVKTTDKSAYQYRMTLTIKNLQKRDAGTYHCAAKNSLGEVDSTIRLYEIPGSGFTGRHATWSPDYDGLNSRPRLPDQPDAENTEKDSVFRGNYPQSGWNTVRRPQTAKPTTSVVRFGQNRPNQEDEPSTASDFAATKTSVVLLLILMPVLIVFPGWFQ